jgi:hypothetical protein
MAVLMSSSHRLLILHSPQNGQEGQNKDIPKRARVWFKCYSTCLASAKVLSSNPSTAKKKKTKQE